MLHSVTLPAPFRAARRTRPEMMAGGGNCEKMFIFVLR